MLLVEKSRMSEQLFDSNVIITSLEEDKIAVTELMLEFNIVGLNYVFLAKSKNIINDYWYWRACEDSLKRASCLVLVMSKRFFLEENKIRRESFWYEVGVMEARGQNVIPYIIDIEKNEWDNYLNKTPIRQKQATNNINDLIKIIETTRAFKKSFYAERDIALYANSRIFYSKISVLFNIKKEVLEFIYDRLKRLDDDDIQTKNDILNLLHREVNFGIKLHRFGRYCFIQHPYYSTYLAEAQVLNLDCNPTNIVNHFTILSQNVNNGVCAVKVDFILPNHEILGVAFKPYMEINKNSVIKKGDLVKLLQLENNEQLCEEKMDIIMAKTDKTERVYFNLYFDDDNQIVECNDEEIGKTCNFFYAK